MQSFSDVLNLVKDYFQEKVRRGELTETAYRCWIKNIEPGRFENNTAYLSVSSSFYRSILVDQYLSQLKEAFEAVLGFPVNVEILCGAEGAPSEPPPSPPAETPHPAEPEEPAPAPVYSGGDSSLSFLDQKIRDSDLFVGDYDYTFDTFIVGSKNEFA